LEVESLNIADSVRILLFHISECLIQEHSFIYQFREAICCGFQLHLADKHCKRLPFVGVWPSDVHNRATITVF